MTSGTITCSEPLSSSPRPNPRPTWKSRAGFENLARAYLRLAEQAIRNAQTDVSYEPPPPKLGDPDLKR